MKPILLRRVAAFALPMLAFFLGRDLWRLFADHRALSGWRLAFDVALPIILAAAIVLVARLISPPGAYDALLEERAQRDAKKQERP
jgi:hypothetical protein